jgi:hypothetical protein
MSNGIVASVTRAGAYEPFDLQVARGQIYGHSTVSIFGYQPSVGTSSIAIWENASAYTFPSSASTMTVASGSATDNGATVLVVGLDANWNQIQETVTIATGGTTTVNSYLRINNLFLAAPASGQTTNVGQITIKVSTTTYAQMNVGIGKSQNAWYSVPANYDFYLDQVEINTSNSYTSSTIVTYNVVATNNVTGTTLSVLQQPFVSIFTITRPNPFKYTQKYDLQFQLKASTGTIGAGLVVNGKLIQANNNVTGIGT